MDADTIFYPIEAAIAEELDRFGKDVQQDIRDSIKTPCPNYAHQVANKGKGGTGNPPPHSPPGGPPFLEVGNLWYGILYAVDGQPGSTRFSVEVAANGDGRAPYARMLENPEQLNRPFMRPAFNRWSPQFRQRMQSVIR